MNKTIKVSCDVMWAYLDKPHVDGLYPDGKYKVNLTNLSEKAVNALEDLGVKISVKDNQGSLITCKSAKPIFAYDTEGNLIDGSTVGNGSKAIATVTYYTCPFGKFPQLNKLVITDLVEYSANGIQVAEDDDLDVL